VVVSGFALISARLAWSRCGIRLRCGGIRLRPDLLHAWRGLIAVFDFPVAVSGFALISAHLVWSRCGIRLRCGDIRLCPILCTPGLVFVMVFDFAVAVSNLALISSRFLQVMVAAPGHGGREIGLWREIIDCVEKNLQTSYCTLPLYFSFPLWNHSLPARLTQFLHSSS